MGAPEVPPLCRETQSLGQQMLELSCENATSVSRTANVGTVGMNGLTRLVLSMKHSSRLDILSNYICLFDLSTNK